MRRKRYPSVLSFVFGYLAFVRRRFGANSYPQAEERVRRHDLPPPAVLKDADTWRLTMEEAKSAEILDCEAFLRGSLSNAATGEERIEDDS